MFRRRRPAIRSLEEAIEALGGSIEAVRAGTDAMWRREDALGRTIEGMRVDVEAMRRREEQLEERLTSEIAAMRDEVDALRRSQEALEAHNASEFARVRDILQLIYDREPEMRERLHALRVSAEYERAYIEPEPLVSVPIATYDRHDLLVSRAIPSVLNGTYRNVEIVIVGDATAPEAEIAVRELDDPRVRFTRRPIRGPYPEDPVDRWYVAGMPPYNEAVAMCQGLWIAPLDDDDAFTPDHIEKLLGLAREERLELAYGLMRCLMSDGSTFNLGTFPPVLGEFGWQAAIHLAGLRFFEFELAAALFLGPADWSVCRRMLRAGVRFGMVDEVVVDHWESRAAVPHEHL